MTPAADDKFDEFQITDSIPSDGKFGSKLLFSIIKHNVIALKSQTSHVKNCYNQNRNLPSNTVFVYTCMLDFMLNAECKQLKACWNEELFWQPFSCAGFTCTSGNHS